MPNLNQCTFQGNICDEVNQRASASGTSIVNFSIRVDHPYSANQEKDAGFFLPVVFFGKQSEFIAKYMKKGDQVIVSGAIKQEEWVDKNSGEKKKKMSLVGTTANFCGKKNQQGEQNVTNMPANQAPTTNSNYQQNNVPVQNDYNSNFDDDIPF